jgi:phospholipid/cholesterol/gamma-HCH transport system substrate-binding protein
VITRQTKFQLLVFALIAVAGLAFTGARYADLGRLVVDSDYEVSADFVDSGGIFTGAEVTYRGVGIGKVGPLTLRKEGVRVAMLIENGTKVPAKVRAVVGNRSAVGEQFVDLQPEAEAGPYLGQGDVIPLGNTEIPIQPTELLVNLDKLVTSVDLDDLAIVLDELGTAFDGAGDDLQRLVDAGDSLTQAATDALPETIALIRDGNTVLRTQNETAGQFQSFSRDLRSLTGQLRASDPDFRALYANGTRSAAELEGVLQANRTALPVLLDNLISTAQVQQVRIPQLRQILVTYPNVVAGGFTVTPGDGTAHFGLVTDSAPPVCEDGYESTTKRPPQDTTLRTPNLNAYCAETGRGPTNVRGARNAEYARGNQPFPESRGGRAAGSGGGGATAQPSSSSSSSSSSDPDASGRDLDTVTLADYDPTSGRAITADGKILVIGSTAGAQKIFGGRSWEWLLLGPLAGS